MTAFADRHAVASKVEWEGGLEGALDNGLKVEHMPEGDSELRLAWALLQSRWNAYAMAAGPVLKLLYLPEQPVQEAPPWPMPA